VIANLMPGRYGVVATPAADRIGRGEEWLQTNTLDGQKAHDAFIKQGGPAYFQEFGPAGYHVAVGFANPAIINNRLTNSAGTGICDPLPNGGGKTCNITVDGKVTDERQSRSPDQRLYSSGSGAAFGFTQCYVSFGDPDDDDFAFAKCDGDGNFTLPGLPEGNWRLTVFDQWNDLIVDGLSTPVPLGNPNKVASPQLCPGTGSTATVCHMGDVAKQQWHTNLYTRSFLDLNHDGVSNVDSAGNPTEPGLTLVPTNIRFRDGSYSNFNNTDLSGFAGFNEIFPLFNWYVLEADTNRYKQTGVHVVYDAGGPADGAGSGANSNIATGYANTVETVHLPTNLRFPGSVYCADADCTSKSMNPTITGGGTTNSSAASPSTGRIDPPWVITEGWQGFIGSSEFVEFGKAPYQVGENGGIKGEVIYASTRPFDDPALLIHTSWTPDVPGVTVNLYKESIAQDGTTTLVKVDTTKTSSWDDWAQGFRTISGATGVPNMNCPGQKLAPTASTPVGDTNTDLFFFTLAGSTQWLNPGVTLPANSQFKCYDGMHNFNQVQPAPYDGMYQFPSVTARDPTSGQPTGTNCTICTQNPNPAPGYDNGAPMLPAGKYVVEIIVPPGYELVKEEDKNILIGDNYIAPVTQQFGGLASIFIVPDQAAVGAAYNANNAQNPTQDLGSSPRHEGDTGSVETFWPCVGALRTVPDYISLFPYSLEVAPFAGASRHLCDRKEVTLTDQTQALAKFWVFSSTHIAAHYTGFILDDFSSEFDPYSPQFGEKFAVPTLPISIKDFAGNEVSRSYSDQWGQYNGLNYSTWEVNPPNPTGYAPTMMVACMNDPGNGITADPYYNPSYSQFCYEIPYMPGQTQYMDTPVVPTAAFAEGYNPPDCAYPDFTPAIASVTGSDGVAGPWVSAAGAGHTLTIAALAGGTAGPGVQVPNNAYSGPSATMTPYNQKFVTRHYGFGPAGTGTYCSGAAGSTCVTIGGVTAPLVGSWSDTVLTVTVPATLPSCQPAGQNPFGQQLYHGLEAGDRCGELVITAANGKKSIDTVMVTAGGATPTVVNAENAANNAIQTAIDTAAPGAMIIVGPGVYNEMLVMWKPIRLQGVGAASVKVNANTHPSGKMDSWRRQVECLFGLTLNGAFITNSNKFDPNGIYSCPTTMQGKVDPIPLEPLISWDPSLNGNLAELLQEPTLLGAYEGAGITVIGKGLRNANTPGVCDAVDATGCIPLTNIESNLLRIHDCSGQFTSNFLCNPARIDGISFVNSSQGGGAIFLHGWNHYTEVSNNRVYANAGTLSGGITIGQPENPDPTVLTLGNNSIALPLAQNVNVQVHNNSVTQNASYGDELNSTTPMAAGGVTFCTGADNYKFNNNWVCGNLSSGDGGGFSQYGFVGGGTITNNWFLFNQSTNPTIPTHGGGLAILGQPPDGTTCENITVDTDCAPTLGDGIGGRPLRVGAIAAPDLLIDANLILGNTAESGSGGGLRLQNINGNDAVNNPSNTNNWWWVRITNNIIVNNVAGWDGAGISLQDALRTDFINNTVVDNDTTASAGVLFNTLGASHANTPPPGCTPNPDPNGTEPSCFYALAPTAPQPAGLSVQEHDSVLSQALAPLTVSCPALHFPSASPTACKTASFPLIRNDLFWQNRAFHIVVGTGVGPGTLNQQNVVTLATGIGTNTAVPNQTATGQCVAGSTVWDIGYRGDPSPTSHPTFTLFPTFSILSSTTGYSGAGTNNIAAGTTNPGLIAFYCNGSRVPPEAPGLNGFGYLVPPGISDATLPNPVFQLAAAATVDEGNNWVNMQYGPLSLYGPTSQTGPAGTPLGNYAINGGPAVNHADNTLAPDHDFFGNTRPRTGANPADIGAVELTGGGSGSATLTASPVALTITLPTGVITRSGTVTITNPAASTANATITAVTVPLGGTLATWFFSKGTDNCTNATLAPGGSCTVTVNFTNVTSPRGVDRTATMTVTHDGVTNPSVPLTGHANP
jgi:hypothetical protein